MGVRKLGGRAWGNALGGWRRQRRTKGGQFMSLGAGLAAGGSKPYAKGSNYRPSRNQMAAQAEAKARRAAKRRKTAKNVAKGAAIGVGIAAVGFGAYSGYSNIKASNARDHRAVYMALPKGTGHSVSPSHWDKPVPKIKVSSGKMSSVNTKATPGINSVQASAPKVPMTYRIQGGDKYTIAKAPASVIPSDMTGKELLTVSEFKSLRAKGSGRVGAAIRWGKRRGADNAKAMAKEAAQKKAKAEVAAMKDRVQNPSPPKTGQAKPATGSGSPKSDAIKAAVGVRAEQPGQKIQGEAAPPRITKADRSAANKAAHAMKTAPKNANQPLPEELLSEMKSIMPGLENVFARKDKDGTTIIVPHPDFVAEMASTKNSIKTIERGLAYRYGSDLDKTQVRAIKIAIKAKRDTMRKGGKPAITESNPRFIQNKDGSRRKVSNTERRAAAMAGEVVVKQQGTGRTTSANLNDNMVKAKNPTPGASGRKPPFMKIIEELGLGGMSKRDLMDEINSGMYENKEKAAIKSYYNSL